MIPLPIFFNFCSPCPQQPSQLGQPSSIFSQIVSVLVISSPGALSSLVIFVIFVFFSLLLLLPRLDTAIYRLCAYLLRINGAPRPLPPFIMHPRAPLRRLRLLLDSKIIFGSRLAGGFGSATVRAVLLLLFALLCYLSCLVMAALAHVYL